MIPRISRFFSILHILFVFLLSGCAGLLGGGLQSATSDSDDSTGSSTALNSLDEIAKVGDSLGTPGAGGAGGAIPPLGEGAPGGGGIQPLPPPPGTGSVPLPAPFPGTAGATPGWSPPLAGNNPPSTGGTQIGESTHPTGPNGKFCDVKIEMKFATTLAQHEHRCEMPEILPEDSFEICEFEGTVDPFGNYQKPRPERCEQLREAAALASIIGPKVRISQDFQNWNWNQVYEMRCLPEENMWEWRTSFEKVFERDPVNFHEAVPETFNINVSFSQNGEWVDGPSYQVTVDCDISK